MFYVLIFGILAVVLVVSGIGAMSRRRESMGDEVPHATHSDPRHHDADHHTRKAKRAQSRHDRRKR